MLLSACGCRAADRAQAYPHGSSRSDSKSAEHKKSSSEATWIFCMEPFFFGIIKGEQPLIRGSSASKSLALFWFSFGAKREQSPPGCSASKSPCPCRAKHAAFASQTGLRLKSPTGAFMPSGHRRPFWFSFGAKREQSPPGEALSSKPETFIYLLFFRFHCSRRIHARMLR